MDRPQVQRSILHTSCMLCASWCNVVTCMFAGNLRMTTEGCQAVAVLQPLLDPILSRH